MSIAYFDLIGGASGDMLLGALIDAGLSLEALRADLHALHLNDWSLETERVTRGGIAATRAIVRARDAARERALNDLLALVAQSDLPPAIRAPSEKVLRRLGQVEAHLHNVPLEKIHLHELGGMDTLIDVVGAVAGLHRLGIAQVFCAPFPLARGMIETRHGAFPLPAPATLALIHERGAPIMGVEGDMETVTPTGAAILTTLAQNFGELPAMNVRALGYGAGTRDDAARPNLLRVLVGAATEKDGESVESLRMLETNIDDLNPQFFDYAMQRLLERGALDVTLTPLQMKKNRPATLVRVLCRAEHAAELRAILFEETSTLGIREQGVTRYSLAREIISVDTRFGTLRAKIAHRPNGEQTIAPEYDDCSRAARAFKAPLRAVWEEVIEQAQKVIVT
ncbi:MAG: nickel pincer cofactor biosynthesis protein LarC [Chloroflexi bacterium]|nr:nickel pincer cofactor biosynthesis protein LarC [Chloroflexota bacterium]